MKKTATGLTLAATLALSAFAAAPASAAPAFNNCGDVYRAGFSHIPKGHEWYQKKFDGGGDGIACENNNGKYKGLKRLDNAAAPAKPAPKPSATTLPDHVTQPDSVDNKHTYPDCKDVFAAGLANLPKSSKYYHVDLDADLDGIGCEVNGDDAVVPAAIVAKYTEKTSAEPTAPAASAPAAEKSDAPQVTEVPVGAPDTGVVPDADPAAALAVGALGLVAVAGAGVAMRRRNA